MKDEFKRQSTRKYTLFPPIPHYCNPSHLYTLSNFPSSLDHNMPRFVLREQVMISCAGVLDGGGDAAHSDADQEDSDGSL